MVGYVTKFVTFLVFGFPMDFPIRFLIITRFVAVVHYH